MYRRGGQPGSKGRGLGGSGSSLRRRRRECLLEIAYRKRETFAGCCEAFGRRLVLGKIRAERERLPAEHGRSPPSGVPVDPDEYRDILREAIAARNGWKRILARCAPSPAGT